MVEFLKGFLDSLTWQGILIGILIFILSFAINLALVSFILVKLPGDYFRESYARKLWQARPRTIRVIGLIAKNILGLLLVALGVVLSLPGVPGQGVLTILLGIMLLDFPGRRRLELWLVSRPRVFKAVNNLRHRFGKAPLVLD
jgi:hypothetical protein